MAPRAVAGSPSASVFPARPAALNSRLGTRPSLSQVGGAVKKDPISRNIVSTILALSRTLSGLSVLYVSVAPLGASHPPPRNDAWRHHALKKAVTDHRDRCAAARDQPVRRRD